MQIEDNSLKISIITVCYNSEAFISQAIESILSQTYKNIEYIIIDGGSKDSTLKILEGYRNNITVLVSEPDKGIYDAMNKGLKLATGDIVGILNSDDLYFSNDILSNVASEFQSKEIDCLFADLVYVFRNDTNKIARYWKTDLMPKNGFFHAWHPPHPSFFVKRNVYEKFGYFKDHYRFSADFELMLRLLQKNKLSYSYLPEPFVRMRLGGATSKNLKNTINGNLECIQAFKDNGLKAPFLYPLYRFLFKIRQIKFVKKNIK